METRVINIYANQRQSYIYIGRGRDPGTGLFPAQSWGNPFPITAAASRDSVVADHMAWMLLRPWLVERARTQLKGQTLGCYCKPKACHGDNLALIADSVPTRHVAEKHVNCTLSPGCSICDGGLTVCAKCGGAEGGLTTECPGARYDLDRVYAGKLNFICGQWVNGSLSIVREEQSMPYWCGPVYFED